MPHLTLCSHDCAAGHLNREEARPKDTGSGLDSDLLGPKPTLDLLPTHRAPTPATALADGGALWGPCL